MQQFSHPLCARLQVHGGRDGPRAEYDAHPILHHLCQIAVVDLRLRCWVRLAQRCAPDHAAIAALPCPATYRGGWVIGALNLCHAVAVVAVHGDGHRQRVHGKDSGPLRVDNGSGGGSPCGLKFRARLKDRHASSRRKESAQDIASRNSQTQHCEKAE